MYKKTITYTDYNGVERTEDFYFHLNKAQILKMEADANGGYADKLQKIAKSGNGAEIMKFFRDFILDSYGIKDEDGKHFRKSAEISKDFEDTEAYSELLIELCTNTESAIAFISGIFPFSDEQRKEFVEKASTTALPTNT